MGKIISISILQIICLAYLLKAVDAQTNIKINDMDTTIYKFTAKSITGEDISFSKYRGKVLLIVNTASKCGFTPQYEGLQQLYKDYNNRGLEILGFPCNQFGSQEPGEADEIMSFCELNYGVTFQMFEKIDVNGKFTHPVYRYLKTQATGSLGTKPIKWNFTKFLIDKNGNVIKRFGPSVKPKDIIPNIEDLLAG